MSTERTSDWHTEFKGKKILVMGLGLHGGGVGAAKFLSRAGARIIVTDLRTPEILKKSIEALKSVPRITYVLGKHRIEDFEHADLVIKNPGVPADSPYLAAARRANVPITTDIGIFFRFCPATIIGITGTRGKSTTASLIFNFLKKKHGRVFLGGNIRTSVFEFLESARSGDLIVLELSSFQLEDLALDNVSPPYAVLTNLMPDHLNRHGTMARYASAKQSIFKFQKKGDVLFVNSGDPGAAALARRAPAGTKVIKPRLAPSLRAIVDERLGNHYESAAALACAVAGHLGVSSGAIKEALTSFPGLEGRQEMLGMGKRVHFVNDTTSTIPEAAIVALKRFAKRAKEANSRVILIAGGQDKKLVFKEFAQAIVRYAGSLVLLPGTATEKLRPALKRLGIKGKCFLSEPDASSMDDAVRRALALSRSGDWIVLSPGAASFGLFANEFDRGDQFVAAAKSMAGLKTKISH